ncbi:GNAT family N-acetyltransferase [Noviherbaspirillum saxi]|uniref:GNAT family N-acetyltransferase n=1 Tax=Noviherbaspirillum saxi TaxID=2320863 RepID=A0A3A3FNK5_9BURK|nr:GNAT family N-acetyltransferase [Noviherbaspirillum saxi]
MRLSLGDWALQQAGAKPVRHRVFVIEQKVPLDMEWDEMDAQCLHAVVHGDDGEPIATGRLLPDGHIGRMAVVKSMRGDGIGGLVLQALMEEARKRGDRSVVLSAQTQAEPFYQRHGFTREGEEFMEAGIPHVQMRHVFA